MTNEFGKHIQSVLILGKNYSLKVTKKNTNENTFDKIRLKIVQQSNSLLELREIYVKAIVSI